MTRKLIWTIALTAIAVAGAYLALRDCPFADKVATHYVPETMEAVRFVLHAWSMS